MDKILPLMIKVGRFQYHLLGVILVGFICVGKEFITLWLGPEYIRVYYCAILLLLPAPFYLSQQIGKNTMVMVNQVRYLTYVNVIKAVLNVVLVAILSIYWGAVGACVSICLVYFFRNFANMYLYKHKLGLNTKLFCVECYGKMSIPILLTLLLGLLGNQIVTTATWLGLILKIVVLIVIYLVLMWIMAYNSSEKDMISGMFRKILRKR